MGEFTLINRGHFSHSESHPSGRKEEKCVQLESQYLFLLFVKSFKKIFLGTKEHLSNFDALKMMSGPYPHWLQVEKTTPGFD